MRPRAGYYYGWHAAIISEDALMTAECMWCFALKTSMPVAWPKAELPRDPNTTSVWHMIRLDPKDGYCSSSSRLFLWSRALRQSLRSKDFSNEKKTFFSIQDFSAFNRVVNDAFLGAYVRVQKSDIWFPGGKRQPGNMILGKSEF